MTTNLPEVIFVLYKNQSLSQILGHRKFQRD